MFESWKPPPCAARGVRPVSVFGRTSNRAQSSPIPVYPSTIELETIRYWSRTGGETVVPFGCEAGTLNSTVWVELLMQCPAVSSAPLSISQPVQPIGIIRPTKGWFDEIRSSTVPHIASLVPLSVISVSPPDCRSEFALGWGNVSSARNRSIEPPKKLTRGCGTVDSNAIGLSGGSPITISDITAVASSSIPIALSPSVIVTVNFAPLKIAVSPSWASSSSWVKVCD